MIKTLAFVVSLCVGFWVGHLAGNYAERRKWSIPRIQVTGLAFMITLFIAQAIILALDAVGWYPD